MRGGSSIFCFPLYLAPAYVAAAKAAREIDGVHCRIGACLRLRHIAAEGSYINDAAAIGDKLAAPDSGSGMEHSCAVRSEERRVGKECGSSCRLRWSPFH